MKEEFGHPTLQLKKISENSHEIWKSLAVDEQVELKEGDNIKLADIEFTVKKICHNYGDLEGLHDNLNTTLSEVDINENLNLGNSIRRGANSRNLKRSKYIERSMCKN